MSYDPEEAEKEYEGAEAKYSTYSRQDGAIELRIRPNIKNYGSTIDPGIYSLDNYMGVVRIDKLHVELDRFIPLPDPAFAAINQDISTFLNPITVQKYKKRGLVHKRGLLMYGTPGTGKTQVINRIALGCVKHGMIVLYNPDPYNVILFMKQVSTFIDDPRILVLWEEFDRHVLAREWQILQLLDGMQSIDGSLFLMTTNFIDRVPDRVKFRPSRIARLIEVLPPEHDARVEFIKHLSLPEDGIDANALADITGGLVLDAIKDVVLSSAIFGDDLNEAVERIRKLSAQAVTGSSSTPTTSDDDDDDD